MCAKRTMQQSARFSLQNMVGLHMYATYLTIECCVKLTVYAHFLQNKHLVIERSNFWIRKGKIPGHCSWWRSYRRWWGKQICAKHSLDCHKSKKIKKISVIFWRYEIVRLKNGIHTQTIVQKWHANTLIILLFPLQLFSPYPFLSCSVSTVN